MLRQLVLLTTLLILSPGSMAGGALYLKYAPSINLLDEEQTFLSDSRTLHSPSSSLAATLEWRTAFDFAIGLEYLQYGYEYSPPKKDPPLLPSNGEAEINSIYLTLRKYFKTSGDRFFPYASLGYGTAKIDVSHPLTGAPPQYDYEFDHYSSTSYQVAGGLEMRFFSGKKRQLGVVIEMKYVGFTDIGANRFDPSGAGMFFGVGLVRN